MFLMAQVQENIAPGSLLVVNGTVSGSNIYQSA
jgi:hypothetical protein